MVITLPSSQDATFSWLKLNELDTFIKNYYYCEGNVSDIKDAKIVCLGEDHGDEQNHKMNAIIINSLHGHSKKDLLLVEAHARKREFIHQVRTEQKFVDDTIPAMGWDMRDDETFTFYYMQRNFYTLLSIIDSIYLIGSQLLGRSIYTGLHVMMSAGSAAMAYLSNKMMDWNTRTTFIPSNNHMAEVLERCRKKHRKIFLIAGMAHLKYDPVRYGPGHQEQEYKTAANAIRNYLKDHKHIILIPKPYSEITQHRYFARKYVRSSG